MPRRSESLQTVIDFCLEHAAESTVSKRIKLYRGLAEFCGNKDHAAKFYSMAQELENADQLCREFTFEVLNEK